jgi:hypothetical protein
MRCLKKGKATPVTSLYIIRISLIRKINELYEG